MRARDLMSAMVVLAVILGTVACGRSGQSSLGAEDLGVIAARIHAEPEREADILEEYGLTREDFLERVWDVSEDPDASRRYTEAMEQELERTGTAPR
jgi:hypothetical protein